MRCARAAVESAGPRVDLGGELTAAREVPRADFPPARRAQSRRDVVVLGLRLELDGDRLDGVRRDADLQRVSNILTVLFGELPMPADQPRATGALDHSGRGHRLSPPCLDRRHRRGTSRVILWPFPGFCGPASARRVGARRPQKHRVFRGGFGGRRTRDRTWDLGLVRAALFQLSYPPVSERSESCRTLVIVAPPDEPGNVPERLRVVQLNDSRSPPECSRLFSHALRELSPASTAV